MLGRASSSAAPSRAHRGRDEVGDADPGRARAEEHEALSGQRFARARSAARMPPSTTAAVPWMSSLKLGSRCR